MKSKLNPVFIIIGLFLLKVGIIDNFRFHGNNASMERRVASIEESRKAVRD